MSKIIAAWIMFTGDVFFFSLKRRATFMLEGGQGGWRVSKTQDIDTRDRVKNTAPYVGSV